MVAYSALQWSWSDNKSSILRVFQFFFIKMLEKKRLTLISNNKQIPFTEKHMRGIHKILEEHIKWRKLLVLT